METVAMEIFDEKDFNLFWYIIVKLRDSKDSAECNWAEFWSHYDNLAHSKRHT